MLLNYVQNIVSNNTFGVNGGYGSVNFFIPFLLIVSAVKFFVPFFNTQMVLYGCNLAFGFVFFYLFLGLIHKGEKASLYEFFAKAVASLFYVFSLFLVKTLYSHQLLALYSVSVFPAVLYFFTRSIQEKRIYFSVLAACIYSACSSTFLSLPWYAALGFSSLFLFLGLFLNEKKRFFYSVVVFGGIVLLLNFYWMFHQMYPLIQHQGNGTVLQSAVSDVTKQNSIDLIQALSHLNPPIHQMSAYIRTSWEDRMNLGFVQSYGLIYIFIVLLGGIFLTKNDKKLAKLFIIAVSGLLFSFLLVTPNFGDWNVGLFQFFNNHIPLFTMFRNMYDKFGVAVSFQFGLALFVSLLIIGKNIHSKRIRSGILFVLVGITIWNARIFLFLDKSSEGISGTFNTDYMALVSHIKLMKESSRFTWLPLNFSSYSVIEDEKNPEHFYYGSSPIQFLAKSSDYTGFQSFATASDGDLNFQMLGLLREKKYDEIGQILQRMNTKYIINYHYNIPAKQYDHMNFEGAIDQQNEGMLELLAGKKILDFGTRYTLYMVNEKYHSEKIFLADTFDSFPKSFIGVAFQKTSPAQYEMTIQKSSDEIFIAFLEPFDSLWKLEAVDAFGYVCQLTDMKHEIIYRYGNGWTISRDAVRKQCPKAFQNDTNGNETLQLRIKFKAQQYSNIVNIVSIVFWCLTIGYFVAISVYRIIKK